MPVPRLVAIFITLLLAAGLVSCAPPHTDSVLPAGASPSPDREPAAARARSSAPALPEGTATAPRPQLLPTTATLDQISNAHCQQTIYAVYRKTFCPDREQVLENLFAQPFELNKPAWLATCENGPFTEVVEIDGPTRHTARSYSYAVTVKFWYPAGKGSGPEAFTALIFMSLAVGEDGVCRIAGTSGGG